MNSTVQQLQPKHIVFIACLIVLIATGLVVSTVIVTSTGFGRQQAVAETSTTNPNACAHSWQKELELVHHDAVTQEVQHAPRTTSDQVFHTVCNICGDIIDGKTAQHASLTGHESYTTSIPFMEERIVEAAWTETVIEQDAYDELVAKTERCSFCGAVRTMQVEQVSKDA